MESDDVIGRGVRYLLWVAGGLAAAVSVALLVTWGLWARVVEPAPPFEAHPLELRTHTWYDVGAVDINGDSLVAIVLSVAHVTGS